METGLELDQGQMGGNLDELVPLPHTHITHTLVMGVVFRQGIGRVGDKGCLGYVGLGCDQLKNEKLW